MKKVLFLFLINILIYTATFAQEGFEVGGLLGTAHYFGDLNTSYSLALPGASASIFLRKNFNERLCLKISGNYGRIRGDDKYSTNTFEKERNLSFRSDVFDLSGSFEFNFLPYVHGSSDQYFTPYLFAGLSVFNFNPKAKYNDQWVALRDLGTEGQFKGEEYSSNSGALLFGGGFKIDLNESWSVNVEVSARKVFTDYLDDVSGLYGDKRAIEKLHGIRAALLSDRSSENTEGLKIGTKGRQRGNGRNDDAYVLLGVGLSYYFGDLKCPKIFDK